MQVINSDSKLKNQNIIVPYLDSDNKRLNSKNVRKAQNNQAANQNKNISPQLSRSHQFTNVENSLSDNNK